MLLPYFVFASESMTTRLQRVGKTSGYVTTGDDTQLAVLVGRIINIFFSILGVVFIVLIVLAGFKWMTAQGDDNKVKEALSSIRHAILGLIITLSAYAIWAFVEWVLISGGSF